MTIDFSSTENKDFISIQQRLITDHIPSYSLRLSYIPCNLVRKTLMAGILFYFQSLFNILNVEL